MTTRIDSKLDIPSVGYDVTEPNPEGVAHAFSRIGYRLDEALADLIDNSIDASATTILIRFVRTDITIDRIVIADDGEGMDDAFLRHAMQFGARIKHKKTDLGKYGIGLKSASFSQCRKLSVVTRHKGHTSARRWTIESIRKGWNCERLDLSAAQKLMNARWNSLNLREQGTLVIWDDLDHLQISKQGIESTINNYFRSLPVHLGLRFHRFLSAKKIRILLDAQNHERGETNIAVNVTPLDPFKYPRTGKDGFPKTFKASIPGVGELKLTAHIWPPKSSEPEYKLGGGKVSARQGFYFYRNDRLIQAGGWNGCLQDETEPHNSLARVSVNLPPDFDAAFSLNVQKSSIDAPPEFIDAVSSAKIGDYSFSDYISDANNTYRKHDVSERDFPLLPEFGISAQLQRQVSRIIAPNSKRFRSLYFGWAELPDHLFFFVDRDQTAIFLNQNYRHSVLNGRRSSAADAPIIKLLLYLLLKGEFDKQITSAKQREWLETCNDILVAAIRSQR